MSKEITAPNIVHGNSSKEFDNFFHEQCKKVEYSHNRISIVNSPNILTKEYLNNYDMINWSHQKQQLKKNL